MLFIFDMGAVVTHDEGFNRRLSNMLKMNSKEFYDACAGGCNGGVCREDIMKSLTNGEITPKQFCNEIRARTGREIIGEPWSWAFNPVRDEAVVSIIHRLRDKGERVVCGTNTIECHYMTHIERGDYALFDKVYASYRMGISKPDAAFWETILMAEEVEPRDAFFTDDREDNCEGALKLCINVHHFIDAKGLEKAVQKWI